MGIVAKLTRTAPSADDPLRVELRRAIDAHAQAKAERDRVASANEKAEQRTWEQCEEIERLREQIAEMESNSAQRAAQRVIAGADQKRLADAEELLATAQSASEVIKGSAENAESVLKLSADRNRRAAGAVLASHAAQIEAMLREHLAEVARYSEVLSFIHSRDSQWPPTPEQRGRPGLISNIEIMCQNNRIVVDDASQLRQRYEQAFQALIADAGAPLPEV